ncbi:ISBma2, transposase [Clostridium botulinum CFSAN001628]|nr:ISBma2, transposase [Clostridium botulinum CFSAN001628]
MENTKVLFVRNLGIKEEEKLLSVVLHIQKIHMGCARFQGIKKVAEQCLLTAIAQNMKKIARMLSHNKLRHHITPCKCMGLLRNLNYMEI